MKLSIGYNLKTLRKKYNLTQSQLAKKLNISRQRLANYELEKREPDLITLIKISSFFNCSIEELILKNSDFKNLTLTKELYFKNKSLLTKLKEEKEFLLIEKKKFMNELLKLKKFINEEIPKKIKEIDELIEFLENKESNVSEKINDPRSNTNNTKNLNKDLEKNKKDTEIGEEICIEDIYLEEFSYLKNKYEFKNIKDFFRPIYQVGDVSCGLPSYAFEDIENTYLLPKCYLYEKEKYFILKAKGDSMNKLFEEGEKILVRQSSGVNNGDIIIAFIPDGEGANCKKYYEDGDNISLVPCSTNEIHKVQNYKANEICILGIVIGKLDDFLEDIDFEELEEAIKDELED